MFEPCLNADAQRVLPSSGEREEQGCLIRSVCSRPAERFSRIVSFTCFWSKLPTRSARTLRGSCAHLEKFRGWVWFRRCLTVKHIEESSLGLCEGALTTHTLSFIFTHTDTQRLFLRIREENVIYHTDTNRNEASSSGRCRASVSIVRKTSFPHSL